MGRRGVTGASVNTIVPVALVRIITLALTLLPAGFPRIVGQPQGTVSSLGGGATVKVSLAGQEPFGCQWWLNNAPITGATNATLTLPSVTAADVGWYSVLITNQYGAVTSAPVGLTALGLELDNIRRAELSIYGPTSMSYQVDHAEEFSSTNPWLLFTNFTLTNSPQTLRDFSTTNVPVRFYRVTPRP